MMPGGGVPPPPSAYMGASLEAEPAVGPGMGAGWKHCGGEVLPSTKPEAVRETHKAERLGESDRDREKAGPVGESAEPFPSCLPWCQHQRN